MNPTAKTTSALLLGFAITIILMSSTYTLDQTEQAILTKFGHPLDAPVTEPGLHFKMPLFTKVNTLDKRYLPWDGPMVQMTTKDKTYIEMETFARWRISDPMKFFLRLKDERSAQSRLEDVLASETRSAVARYNLIEVIRTDKNRKPVMDENIKAAITDSGSGESTIGGLKPNEIGRAAIEKEILAAASPKLLEYGIELLDVRFKRTNYNQQVLERIYQRMTSERMQIANRFRSEGEGEAAKIAGNKERDMNEIQSTAYKRVQEIQGEADAKATEIYAKAYGQNPEAAEFYKFTKKMETYRKVMDKGTTLVLSTGSELYEALKGIKK